MDLQSSILSALIPRTQSEKEEANLAFAEAIQLKLAPKHFTGHYRFLFEVVGMQVSKPSILDREILETYLSDSSYNDEGKAQVRILFAMCREATVELDKLKTLIPSFLEQQGSKEFGLVLKDTATILTDGLIIGRNEFKGLEDAKQYLIKHAVNVISGAESTPQGAIGKSLDKFWENYNQAKSNPDYGIKSGIRELDLATGGARPGELFVTAGYAKEGKSVTLRNWAYNSAIKHGKNVVYASLEMSFSELKPLFVSLHSTHPKFKNTMGIKAFSISDGRLSPEDETRLKEVTDDWENCPDYGILYVIQMPSGSTVSSLRNSLVSLSSLFPIDAFFLDYASLLKPETRMDTTTMQVTAVYKDLKDLALTFNDGKGIPIITAHQTSRVKREAVDKSENKRYDMGYLSDSSEVERSSDMVAWILRTPELVSAREVKMGLSYFRRGRTIPDWRCREYYDCSLIESMSQSVSSFGTSAVKTPEASLNKLVDDL